MKPVFFIDYDNTIFSHQTASIPESAVAALKMLQEKGCPVAIASGRSLRTSQLPEELREHFTPDCFVSSNGAIVEIEGKLVWEKYFDLPDLRLQQYLVHLQYRPLYEKYFSGTESHGSPAREGFSGAV